MTCFHTQKKYVYELYIYKNGSLSVINANAFAGCKIF